MNLLKLFLFYVPVYGDVLPMNRINEHGCRLDRGYQWCESTHECQLEPCENIITQYCKSSKSQFCRMICPDPICMTNQCAMRSNNCCEYTCSEISKCSNECPSPMPCPMPPPNCNYIPSQPDNCGCQNGCGTIDCSISTSLEGETCGGYMPQGMARTCIAGLECAYTMGPYIADAPGTCQQICQTFRDNWGNCVDEDCINWYDGCNTCNIHSNINFQCTEKVCYQMENKAYCIDNQPIIPNNCLSWYDGCNTCGVKDGKLKICTLMMCFITNESYCITFRTGALEVGDICYRFCEDNSQTAINRRGDCSLGTECSSLFMKNQVSMISYDSCGNRAFTCNLISGH